jgi:ATP dependent DNA ligase-like protein
VEGLVRPMSPFADLKRAPSVTWLEPRLVAEVSYSELIEDRLRDPVLRQLHVAVLRQLHVAPFDGAEMKTKRLEAFRAPGAPCGGPEAYPPNN